MNNRKCFLKYIALVAISALTLTACGNTAIENTAIDSSSTEIATENFTTAATSTETATESSSAAATSTETATESSSIIERHGALRVQGADLVDQNGEKFQLYGMSTHGLSWFPQYVSYETFLTLRDDWNTNCVRLAMYTAEYNGYCTGGDKEQLKTLVQNGVDYATELGMYVIIDWHVLNDQDPNVYKEEAKTFFDEMSSIYADYNNVIYEICNEPNGYASWDSVKNYANEVIPVIRANDNDAIIIVGTPTWSQDIDKAAASLLEHDNILYALHFYAGTHKDDLRNRLDTCASNGLPIFVSEFGTCDASGNGANDFESTAKWLELIDQYNISFCCWNLANKDESSSILKSTTTNISNWTEEELTESGVWMREFFRGKK